MGPQSLAASLWPLPQSVRKSPSWKGSGEQGPTPASSSEKFPSGNLGEEALWPPPAGPLDLSQVPDEELPLQVGDLGPRMGLHL